MNIDKAIRKQKKSYKRFLLSMCFIFFVLPIALFLSKKLSLFYISYLVIIEVLIFIAVIIRIDKETLRFACVGSKLKISLGIRKKTININCEKVSLVHTEDILSDEDDRSGFRIILLATSKFRSERMIPVNLNFLKNHSYVAHQYNRLKIIHPEEQYYYTIIKRGKLNKYPLLDVIYKNCVYSHFTEECIEKIKFYRQNSQYYRNK
jgi:hypothetical protein